MAVSKKTSSTSSTSSSAKTRPNGTTAAVNISKSAKENATTVTQATMCSSAKTTAGNGLKPAAKPLQARIPSSQGVKDTDIAALLAKVAAQEGLSKCFLLALC
jgi:hypothetical protein